MKKKIFGLLFVCLVAVLAVVTVGRTNYKAYYSGDAIAYRGQLIIASTDTGSLEVFKLNGSSLERTAKLKAPNSVLDRTDDFSSVKFNIEDGRLYAYAVSAYTLYKYDVSDPAAPSLYAKQKNTYYEWYHRVDRFGSSIVTISDHGLKVWKTAGTSLDVIDSYKLDVDVPSAVNCDASGRYITTINSDNIARIYDTDKRQVISQFPVNYKNSKTRRQTYFDPVAREIYVFDDYYLKRFSLSGRLLASQGNSAANGYSVEEAGNSSYVYAANGDSIMKLSKGDLKTGLKISAWNLTAKGYAMGLKYVDLDGSDNLVVFNNEGIAVVNSSLKKIASVQASEIADEPQIKEPLSLSLDHEAALPGTAISLSGTGYLPNEALQVAFDNTLTKAQADNSGRFQTTITVPDYRKDVVDVKVDGLKSKLTYSTTFKVIKSK
jgi:hypothetical protein